MKAARILMVVLCLVAVAPLSVGEAVAHRGWVGVSVGTGWDPWWGPWGPWGPWGYSSPWYYPVVVAPPEPPPVYIEKSELPSSAFWYYCRNPGGYYPYVGECREGWLKVLPQKEK